MPASDILSLELLPHLPQARDYAEAWEWSTDIARSNGGNETRVARSNDTIPVRSITFPWQSVSRVEQTAMHHRINIAADETVAVPLWFSRAEVTQNSDGTTITVASTAYREFEYADAVTVLSPAGVERGSDTIASVAATTITVDNGITGVLDGDWAIPIITCTAEKSNRWRSRGETIATGTVSLLEVGPNYVTPSLPSAGMGTYKTSDIFEPTSTNHMAVLSPLEPAVTNSYIILGARAFQQTTKVSLEPSEMILGLQILCEDTQGIGTLRDFFCEQKGALTAFWVASQRADWRTVEAALSGASTIKVAESREVEGLKDLSLQRHAYIPSLDQCVELNNPTLSGDDIVFTVDPVLSGDLASGAEVQALYLGRFDNDRLEITSAPEFGDEAATATLQLRELQGETP